jgi:hypothetical protein
LGSFARNASADKDNITGVHDHGSWRSSSLGHPNGP